MDIYIITTEDNGGTYIGNATTDAEEARLIAEAITDGYLMQGYFAPRVQIIPPEEVEAAGTETPAVTAVYHLQNAAGERHNVAITRIRKK